MKKPQRSNPGIISRWKTDARKVSGSRPHVRAEWPRNIRRRAVRLMRSGVPAAELARGSAVAEHTLHPWRQRS